jgi:hypothetical protein
VAQSVTDTVNQFFMGNKSYQDVTLEAVVAIQSYYNTFPFAWAGYASGTTTYYLYSSSGSATSFVGTISLTPPASLDITKPNAGYTCTFTPASNGSDTTTVDVDTSAAKSLTYTGGLFVAAVSSDASIAVKGTFQSLSLFTTKPTDTQVITVLTGTIGAATCIGFDQPQLSSDPSATFWDTLFHPQNSAEIWQSVMEIAGAVVLVLVLGQMALSIYRYAKAKFAAKEPTTKEQMDDFLGKVKEIMQERVGSEVKELSGGRQSAPADDEDAASLVKEDTSIIADEESEGKLLDGYTALDENLKTVAEFAQELPAQSVETLESLGTSVEESVQAIQGTTPADVGAVLPRQTADLSGINTDFATFEGQVSSLLSQSEQSSIQANQDRVESAQQDAENSQESDEELPEEDNPDVGESIQAPEVFE